MGGTRTAECWCGKLKAFCEGEPVRVSVCHCLACQRRTGSAFSAQLRFPRNDVRLEGEATAFVHTGDAGNRATFLFCPDCGSTIAYSLENDPDLIAVPLGAFADRGLPHPHYSVYEERKHGWVEIVGEGIDHLD